LSRITGLADRFDGQDYYTLLLGATLGMCIMASANHLLTVFLGVEMASVPSYVLAGMVKSSRRAGEAALKYAVYGAGAAGVMLYGITLLAGLTGTAHLPTLATQLARLDILTLAASGENNGVVLAVVLSMLMIGVGLAFKLAAVPFHFWCPDVFEGATAEVAGYLSVASKAAAIALLLRLTVGMVGPLADTPRVADAAVPVQIVALISGDTTPNAPQLDGDRFLGLVVAIVAILTCTFGNLAAYAQQNMKRMLAYSTIAHAGYMMMAVSAALWMGAGGAADAVDALLIYLGIYLFMNLGAFAIVAVLRNAMGSEQISDYAGLVRQCPVLTSTMVILLVGLIGLPPLAGWIGKFAIFMSLAQAGDPLMIGLLIAAGLNTVVSLVYYVNVAKVMCIDPPSPTARPIAIGLWPITLVVSLAIPVVLWGILPASLTDLTSQVARQFVGL
jgi:NADH-quinone oxidoreductase subunit N